MADYTKNYKKICGLLNRAADFLATHKWAKRANAYDKNGCEVEPTSRSATCWCAEGAINRCSPFRQSH